MKKGLRLLAVAGLMVFSLSSFMPAKMYSRQPNSSR